MGRNAMYLSAVVLLTATFASFGVAGLGTVFADGNGDFTVDLWMNTSFAGQEAFLTASSGGMVQDASSSGHTVDIQGGAYVDEAQGQFGASVYCDGAGDFLEAADSTDWDFGNSEFTVDFWMRTTTSGVQKYIISRWAGAYIDWGISMESGGYLRAYGSDLGDNSYPIFLVGSTTVNDGAWHHVAFVRNGATAYLFIDGNQDAIDTSADVDLTHATVLDVGADGQGGRNFNGHIDELRITKGIAQWTSGFTPPTQPY